MIVSAPCSGEMKNSFSTGNRRPTQPPLELAKSGRDGAWMEAIGRHSGTGQPASEFAGEQDIGELRATVDFESAVAVGALQVAEIEASALVGGG